MPRFREVSHVFDLILERIMINLGWTGWIVGSVKVWMTFAAMVEPQVFFSY